MGKDFDCPVICLIKGGRLSMEFEDGNKNDAYGRLFAYDFVDGVSVKETLLKEVFARVEYIMDMNG
ncbi:hypothetical protein [Neobacillus novalis]|nr:hypothetical protein [Neobacillus novalis]